MTRISEVRIGNYLLDRKSGGGFSLQKKPVWVAFVPRRHLELVLGYEQQPTNELDDSKLFRRATPEYPQERGILLSFPNVLVSLVSALDFGDGAELSDKLSAIHIGPHGVSIPKSFCRSRYTGRFSPRTPLAGFSYEVINGWELVALDVRAELPTPESEPEIMEMHSGPPISDGKTYLNLGFFSSNLEFRTLASDHRQYDVLRVSLL